VRRVIHIESRGNARIVSKGNYGLMQIRLGTARAMGYHGTEEGLLDPDTNMTYAVKYLAGAYRAAGCNEARAISYYQRGYHGARRSDCAAPQSPATQIAERPEEKTSVERPSVRPEQRATVAARPASDRAAAPSGDVLKPRLVQTQSISRSRQEPGAQLAAARSEPAPVPAARTQPALMPMPERPARISPQPPAAPSAAELTLTDMLAPPAAPMLQAARLEPAAASMPLTRQRGDRAPPNAAPASVPMPRARPAVNMPSPQAVAALNPEAAAPREKQAKPPHSGTHKRARAGRAVREESGLLAALKRFITPDRTSRRQITQR
jgi:hypothetical protein